MENMYKKTILSSAEENVLLETATIVFDTNILLNFYKYSTGTLKGTCEIINKLKNRLFLPYQVSLEYYYKKFEIIKYQRELPDFLKKSLDKSFNELNLHKESDYYSIIKKHREELKKEITQKARERKTSNPQQVTQFWEDIYQGKVSSTPNADKLVELCQRIKRRCELRIPPSFNDLNKKNNPYGDGLIWFDILEYAKNNKKDVIFVSDDIKNDWVKDGDLRLELLREFQLETCQKIKYYTFETFLRKIAKQQKVVLSKNLKNELRYIDETIRNFQEKYQQWLRGSNINNIMESYNAQWQDSIKIFKENNIPNYLIHSIQNSSINKHILENLYPDLFRHLNTNLNTENFILDKLKKNS